MKIKKIILSLIIAVFVSFITSGCVERKLTIKSDPPGASVYFNDSYKGKTPVDFDFEWYWTHDIRLEKEGYQEIKVQETIKAPPYMWIPVDLLIELLPLKVKDHHDLTYTLELKRENESDNERAEEEINFND